MIEVLSNKDSNLTAKNALIFVLGLSAALGYVTYANQRQAAISASEQNMSDFVTSATPLVAKDHFDLVNIDSLSEESHTAEVDLGVSANCTIDNVSLRYKGTPDKVTSISDFSYEPSDNSANVDNKYMFENEQAFVRNFVLNKVCS